MQGLMKHSILRAISTYQIAPKLCSFAMSAYYPSLVRFVGQKIGPRCSSRQAIAIPLGACQPLPVFRLFQPD
jgi:hypothetical protein